MSADLMYDGINSDAATIASKFPGATRIAYYINGRYAWSQADINLFPNAEHVTISVTASADAGDVLDVENGDAAPGQTAGWIAMRKAAGLYRPTIYCSLDTVPAVRVGTGSYILARDYDIWVALYDGSQTAPPVPGLPPASYAAKQYLATPSEDVSIVYDTSWPHRTAAEVLPAPGGISVTPWEFLNLSWSPVPGATHYVVEVQAPGRPAMFYDAPLGVTHVQTPPFVWSDGVQFRVQAAPGGAWSGWVKA